MLLDDAAFKQRGEALELYLRNDPQRSGYVEGEKLAGVIRGLRAAKLTSRSEKVCQDGMDPAGTGVVHLNDYVDWCSGMGVISDRII